MGFLLPDSSGGPSSMQMHSMAFTQPFSSPINLIGAAKNLHTIPSSSAFSISSFLAGSSSRDRLYTMQTSSAPNLRAERAESIATLPPPMTETCLPTLMGVSYSGEAYDFIRLTLIRNSFEEYIPPKFSPG